MSANPDGTALPPVRVEADARAANPGVLARSRSPARRARRRSHRLTDGARRGRRHRCSTPMRSRPALTHPPSTCFVLTNTRSMGEADAVALNIRVGRTLFELSKRLDVPR